MTKRTGTTLVCEIPAGWKIAFLKRRFTHIALAVHPDHKPRCCRLGRHMKLFDQWEEIDL